MNIIFRHVGSIRPLKNKLYSDENQNLSLKFVETATVSNLITKFIHI